MSFVNYPRILQEDIRKLRKSVAAKHNDPEKVDSELRSKMKLKYSGTEFAYLSALIKKKTWQFTRQSASNTSQVLQSPEPTQSRRAAAWLPRSSVPRQGFPMQLDINSPYKSQDPRYSVPKRLRPSPFKAADLRPLQPVESPQPALSASEKLVSSDRTPANSLLRRRQTKKPLDPNSVTARMRNYSQRVKDKFIPAVDAQKALAVNLRLESVSHFKPLRDIPKLKLFSSHS